MNGKGSRRRKENKALVDKNWDVAFGRKANKDSRLLKAWCRLLDLLGIK